MSGQGSGRKERWSWQYQGDGQTGPSRIKLLCKKTESGTLLKVRLVGAILVIRQVKLGREATIAIRGNQVSLRRVQGNE